jgi:transcriptional regulator with XRE-family HTH domain
MGKHHVAGTAGGIRLKALRDSYGKTQLAVELEASLGIGYLQRLELGKVQYPERDTLERILAALGVRFIERREVLALFGYAVTLPLPTETDSYWAIDVFQAEAKQANIPVYLLDCSHRLLAWNSLTAKLFPDVKTDSAAVLMPRLIFDPRYGIAASILNAETFFSAQIRILHYEQQRCGNALWYNGFVDEMRHYKTFDEYWIKQTTEGQAQVPMRPIAHLTLDLGDGLIQFRLISETFVQDPRFRVIYYMPVDSATIRQCMEWQC